MIVIRLYRIGNLLHRKSWFRNFGDKKVPVIGNDVYVGTGSVIFGEITIGNNVIIGSNTLVNKSIPDNTTVVGNPMKIIQSNRIKKYYELDTKTDPCKKTVLKNH